MQKYMSTLAAALIVTVAGTGGLMSSADAVQAKTFTKHEHIDRDKCYRVKKVPATVEYNTMGELLREASTSWKGNLHKHGAQVRHKHNDAVYIQTRRIIEDQHTTLVPVSC